MAGSPVKIHLQSKTGVLGLIFILGFFVLVCAFLYFCLTDDSSSSKTKGEAIGLFITMLCVFPLLLGQFFDKTPYVSDVVLDENNITLIYKIKTREHKRRKIPKADIDEFSLSSELDRRSSGKSTYCDCRSRCKISLKNGKYVRFHIDPSAGFSLCAYDYILELIKHKEKIPNFKYELHGTDTGCIEDIKYFEKYGKRKPQSKFVKVIFIIFAIGMLTSLSSLVWMSLPGPKLTFEEEQYIKHYEKAIELRTKKRLYNEALKELETASSYVSNDSELYREKAYNYKRLKQYDKAIESAKEGLSYTNRKPVYYKYKNYKFLSNNDDIGLNTILGECYMKIKDYQKAYEAYDYIIKNSKYTYTDTYFERGRALYYLDRYEEALSDFLKHKEIIEKYFEDQKEAEYKDIYPIYDRQNLENVELWINASRARGNF